MRQNRCQSFVWPMAVTAILTLLSLAGTAAGDVQTVRTVVHQSIGTSQSKEDTRAVAVARARRQALEESVPLLERLSVLRDADLTGEAVLALASGALAVTVVEEKSYKEDDAEIIRVVTEVIVDTTEVEASIPRLLTNHRKLAQLVESNRRITTLLARFGELSRQMKRLALVPSPEQEIAARGKFQRNGEALLAQEWFRKGYALWDGNGYDPANKAVEYYTEAIRLDPNYGPAYRNRGIANIGLKMYRQAVKDLQLAINLDPKDDLAYKFRGDAFDMLGQATEACWDWRKSCQLAREQTECTRLRQKGCP